MHVSKSAALRPRSKRSLMVFCLALSVMISVVVSVGPTPVPAVEAAPLDDATKYVPITPLRVLNTSTDAAHPTLGAEDTVTIAPITDAVAAAAGVDAAEVQAVAINLTIFNTVGPGFASVFPAGGDRPVVSSINSDNAGQAIPNVAIVKLGDDDSITIFSKSGSDVIVDVQGVLVASGATTSGRFISLTPSRELDTRITNNPLLARETRTIDVQGAGVPADALAVALNVTVTETRAPGFLTVWRSGDPRPEPASNVNYLQADYTVANSVITGVTNGSVDIFALAETDVIVDVLGYVTGETADESTDGLYVPLAPQRFYDTRPAQPPTGTATIAQGRSIDIAIQGVGDIPVEGVAAVAMNLGMTGAPAPGFLAAYAQDTVRPVPLSTVNMSFPFQTVANHTIAQVSTAGGIDVFARLESHAFVDVTGYFLGAAVEPPPPLIIAPDPDIVPPVPPAPPADTDFEYLEYTDQDGSRLPVNDRGTSIKNGLRYIGWDPCSPITYAVNADFATQEMIDSLNGAIARVEAATGIDFQYQGRVTGRLFVPINFNDPAFIDNPIGAEAVFGFSTAEFTPALAGGTIGIGGLSDGIFAPPDNSTLFYERDGMAIADIDDLDPGAELRTVFMHEISHMLGLAHVSIAAGEIMEPIITSLTEFGNGDLNGLRNAGAVNCGTTLRSQLQRPSGGAFLPATWSTDLRLG